MQQLGMCFVNFTIWRLLLGGESVGWMKTKERSCADCPDSRALRSSCPPPPKWQTPFSAQKLRFYMRMKWKHF